MSIRRIDRWTAGIRIALSLACVPVATAQSTNAATSFDSAGDAGILHEVERASARGIPAEPLLAKVREGRLKRAGTSRIRVAVVALATRLDSARTALGPRATTEELSAGADALAAGATPASLRALREASAPRPVAPSLGVLAQLVASGLPAPRAVAMITALLRRNVAAAQVIAFGNSVEADAAGGVPAEESATFRLHTVGESAATTVTTADPGLPGTMASGPVPPRPPKASTPPKRRP